MPYHGGLDWSGAARAVCVVDATGRIVAGIEPRHDAAGFADMLARLHAASTGLASNAEAKAKGEVARALASLLECLVGEIAKLSSLQRFA